MMLDKGIFLQNPDFIVFYSHFLQTQVTGQCNNRLALHMSKDRSSVIAINVWCKFLMTLQRSVTEMTLIVGAKYFRHKLAKMF